MIKTPISLLTGFLGSGKTTLLSQILQDPSFSNSAVIVNEFGEIGLDDVLVTHSEEQTVEMTTGCLCCTIRGDITETLLDLYKRREKSELPHFDRIIIETTGLADPAPVIHTIISIPAIDERFKLGGVITTVDAVNGLATLDAQEECVKQVAVADRLVLTKTDLKAEKLTELRERLVQLNPSADLLDKKADEFQLEKLFDTVVFDEKTKTVDVQKWLNDEKEDHHHHDHHDHHHHHDVNKHGDGINTFTLVFDDPIPSQSFVLAMQLLISDHGADLLRLKGIVCLSERVDKPIVLHGVQHVFHEPFDLEEWPTDDHRSKIVFVTRNISKQTIETFLDAWLKVDSKHQMLDNLLG